MHIIKTTLAITAAGCLSLITVHAAEPSDSSEARSKHLSSMHRASTGGSDSGKASSNPSTRSHTRHRTSIGTRRSRDRQRTARSRDAPRTVNGMQPSDVNVQVELPRRENENESEN